MPAAWYQVTCELPADCTEAVADRLAELSGSGVCTENRTVDTFSTDDIPEQPVVTLSAWFEAPCAIERHLATIEEIVRQATAHHVEFIPKPPQWRLINDEDWAHSWKIHFKPLSVGKRLLIVPSWEQQAPDDGRELIVLDPGMAFGTGGHETTRLCLECLDELLAEPMTLPLLDLGTGSGILAIAAAKLGVRSIDAVDIDQQAVTVAAENCRINAVADQIRCSATPLQQLPGGYGIILANILAEELVRLASELVSRLAPGGSLILSGILGEREQYVKEGFAPFPLHLAAALSDGEWRCLHYRRL